MRLGRDAETRFLPDGTPIVTLSLAFNHGKKDESGNRATQWIEGGFWGAYAAKAAPTLLKGMQIHAVLEDVHQEEFKKRDGSPNFKLAARVQSFDYADRRPDGMQAPAAAPREQAPAPARQAPPPQKSGGGGSGFDDMDDDIPFISASMHHDMERGVARRMRRYD
jgi:single-strand DNA-binding protein